MIDFFNIKKIKHLKEEIERMEEIIIKHTKAIKLLCKHDGDYYVDTYYGSNLYGFKKCLICGENFENTESEKEFYEWLGELELKKASNELGRIKEKIKYRKKQLEKGTL